MHSLKDMTLPTLGDVLGALSLVMLLVFLMLAPVPLIDQSPALPELRGAMGK